MLMKFVDVDESRRLQTGLSKVILFSIFNPKLQTIDLNLYSWKKVSIDNISSQVFFPILILSVFLVDRTKPKFMFMAFYVKDFLLRREEGLLTLIKFRFGSLGSAVQLD